MEAHSSGVLLGLLGNEVRGGNINTAAPTATAPIRPRFLPRRSTTARLIPM